jgi:hypothetical protein
MRQNVGDHCSFLPACIVVIGLAGDSKHWLKVKLVDVNLTYHITHFLAAEHACFPS